MALSDKERQRRSRAHKRGDHEHCDPDRCTNVTPAVTAVTEPPVTTTVTELPAPADLGGRGRWLWEQLTVGRSPAPAERVLIGEACRMADRLDQLHALLSGDVDTWAHIDVPDDGDLYPRLVINAAMAEARQHANALRGMVAELRAWAGIAGGVRGGAGTQTGGSSPLDELSKRRADRIADAAGR